MGIHVIHTLIIGTILPDLRFFKPSPFTRSMFDAAKSLMLMHKLKGWDTRRRRLR